MVTVVYWIMILLYSLIVFSVYGTGGANCAIQTSLGGWKSLYHMTFFQEYLLVIVGGYVGILPDQLLQMNMATNTFVLYEIGGKVLPSVPILMTIYPFLCVVLLPIMYHVYYNDCVTM